MYYRTIEALDAEGPHTNNSERASVKALLKRGGTHTAPQLMKVLGLERLSSGNIRVRRIILELTLYDGLPVVASREGYRIARTPEELDVYVEWLESYIQSLEFRIRTVKNAWDRYAKQNKPARAPRAPRKNTGVRKSKIRFPVDKKGEKPSQKKSPSPKTLKKNTQKKVK